MSAKYPNTGGGGGKAKTLLCEEWESLLVDALDGKLAGTEAAAFETHRESCLACAQLLEDSKRGSEWLHFLATEPEVPADLVNRILAQTSGAVDRTPALTPVVGLPGGVAIAVPAGVSWRGGWLPAMERHAVQSRWMMTAAMAFFSLAFTLSFVLNQTGVKLNSFHLADLRPTTLATNLTRQFYVADAHVMKYYDNLRFVYEVESRVREMRKDTESAAPVTNATPADKKPVAKHSGGSAQQVAPEPKAVPYRETTVEPMGEPVMAKFEKKQTGPQSELVLSGGSRVHDDSTTERMNMRADRSLV